MWRMMNMLLAAALLAFGLASCGIGGVQGSGRVITETREVSDFNAIDLSGFGELNIEQGSTESLTIEADDNIMPLLTSDVQGKRLVLGTRSNMPFFNVTKLVYTVTVKDLSEINVSGAGHVTAKHIKTNALAVRLSGAGDATVSGTAAEETVELSGLGSYNGGALASERATVRLSGAGNAKVRVSEALDAEISGAGSIEYIGSPQVKQDVSGAGKIRQVNE